MEKIKYYYEARFPFRAIEEAHDRFRCLAGREATPMEFQHLRTWKGPEAWGHDTRAEFAGAYADCDSFMFDEILSPSRFNLTGEGRKFQLCVSLPERSMIEEVFTTFERHLEAAKIFSSEEIQIFIGHGRDKQWRELEAHLRDHHGFKPAFPI